LIESFGNVATIFPKTGKRICQHELEKTNIANNLFDRTHSRDLAVGHSSLGPQLQFRDMHLQCDAVMTSSSH